MAVVVEGLGELRIALKEFAPDIAKNMNKRIRSEVTPIVKDARAKVPSAIFGTPNNWSNYEGINKNPTGYAYFPQYNPSEIRRGLTYSMARQKRTRNGYVSMVTLLNKNPAGAISETAGRSHPQGRPQYATRHTKMGFAYQVRTSRQSMSDNPKAGKMMIDRLDARMGTMKNFKSEGSTKTRGRLLYAAYAENQGRALDAIMKAIDESKAEFVRRSYSTPLRSAA